MSKGNRLRLVKEGKEETKEVIQLFVIAITFQDGKVETFNDIVRIEPTPNGLLVLVTELLETHVFPIAALKKYSFKKKG